MNNFLWQEIFNRFFYLAKLYEEQSVYQEVFQTLRISCSFDYTNLFMKNSFKKTPNFEMFTYSSLIRLPDIYKTQIQAGFLFSTKKKDLNIGGNLVLQRRFELPEIGMFETKGIITLSKQQNSLGVQIVKDFKIGYFINNI